MNEGRIIDVEDLNPGMYFIQFTEKENRVVMKWIKK